MSVFVFVLVFVSLCGLIRSIQNYFIFTTDDGMMGQHLFCFYFYFIRSFFFFHLFRSHLYTVHCTLLFDIVSIKLCILCQCPILNLTLILISCSPTSAIFLLKLSIFFLSNFHSVFIECNEAIVIVANVLGIPSLV